MKDLIKRSVVKTISWRIVAVISSFVITFLFLGSFYQSVSVTVALNLSTMVLYYFHERVWNKTNWGKVKK